MSILDELQVGDEVVYLTQYSEPEIRFVSGVTKTQIKLQSNSYSGYEPVFNRKTGFRKGGDKWTPDYIEPLTDKVRQQIEENLLRKQAKNAFKELSSFNNLTKDESNSMLRFYAMFMENRRNVDT